MAANLNPPSHFSQRLVESEKKAQGTRLLPPSSFQSRDVSDPWQALAQAKGTIDQLQQENELLRSKPQEKAVSTGQKTCEHPCQAIPRISEGHPSTPPPSPLPAHQYFHLQHTADVLSKQATKLAQVRSEVMTLRSQRQREVGELEERLREAEVRCATETATLTAARKCQEEEHKAQINILRRTHESAMATKEDLIASLSKDSKTAQTRYEQEARQLSEKLLTSEESSEKMRNELTNSNRAKDLAIESLQSQLNRLKAYVGDTQAASRSTTQWQAERDKHLRRITDLEKDLDNQRSAVQFLNVRLSSTNEILGIQEAELSRVKGQSADSGKKLQLLLTRWREKVFQLLVQLKSQEIVEGNIRRDHKWQVTELEEKTTSLQNKCHLLEHSIADRDAQLQLERGQSQSLRDELASVQEVAELLDVKLSAFEETVPRFASLLQSFQKKHAGMEENLASVVSRLGAFDQRISFAVGRIEILKGLIARKDALWRLRDNEIQPSIPAPAKDDEGDTQTDGDRLSLDQMRLELQQVTHERDALAGRIKRDSETWQEQYSKVREKFEARQEQDAARLQEVESQLLERTKDLQSVTSKLGRAESDDQESQRAIGRLKTEIAKLQLSTERASVEKMAAMEAQLTNQLAEMEKRLNDARREQAKAVVSLRQLERQTARERERSAGMLQTQEQQLQLEIDRVTSQLRDADRDRNLLMTTLKQEGLVSQYKAQRTAAQRLDSEMEEATDRPSHKVTAKRGQIAGQPAHQPKPKAPLSAILTDLRSLTAQVLAEDNIDDSDTENNDKG